MPFDKWISDLTTTNQARIDAYIQRVALGAARKNTKPVGEGVFEVKIDVGPGYRVYFGEITMPRTESYNEAISKKLKDPKYAQAFIEGLMEGDDGLNAEDALRHTIQIMGIKEFAKVAKVNAPRVIEFTKKKRHLKPETLNTFLKPFKLRTRLILESTN